MSKRIDMTGQQFGDWTVLHYDENSKGGTAKWICRCVCGNEKSVAGPSLRRGESKGCGCRKAINSRENNGTFVNEIGNRYGKLVVIAKDEELSIAKHRAQWVCKCDCGNLKTVSSKCLRDGKTKSCGCMLSVGEEEVAKLLTKYNQQFVSQYGVVIGEKYYRFDFAVIENGQVKYLLEYHGLQHYDDKHLHWGKDVSVNQERDAIKEKWAYDNGIHLYVIPYTEFDNLEEIIRDISKGETNECQDT
jgi:hypothetical protein